MQHDFGRVLWRVFLKALAPIISTCVREDTALPIERRRRDGRACAWISLQSVLGVAVPEMKGPVTACRGESAVFGMEGDCINTVDIADILLVGWSVSVALETEIVACILLFDVLNGAASFDASDGETVCILEAGDDSRLVFER